MNRSPPRQRVLVVEDEPDIRDALADALAGEGYAVAVASNGLEALARARSFHPDLIVLDLMMPVMDGWDFRAQQLQEPALKDIPVFILTAAGFSNETIRTQFGEIPFVPKPPPHDLLLQLVKDVCSVVSRRGP
jgi:CheY-like chemotaxis protein